MMYTEEEQERHNPYGGSTYNLTNYDFRKKTTLMFKTTIDTLLARVISEIQGFCFNEIIAGAIIVESITMYNCMLQEFTSSSHHKICVVGGPTL